MMFLLILFANILLSNANLFTVYSNGNNQLGVLIDDNTVITRANNLNNSVLLKNINTSEVVYSSDIHIHPHYVKNRYIVLHNLAVINVKIRQKYSNYTNMDKYCYISNGKETRKVNITLNKTCISQISRGDDIKIAFNPNVYCIIDNHVYDHKYGYILVCNNKLTGIYSRTIIVNYITRNKKYHIFTNLDSYNSWIKSMNKN